MQAPHEPNQPVSQPLASPIKRPSPSEHPQPSPSSLAPDREYLRSVWWFAATVVLLFLVLPISTFLSYQAGYQAGENPLLPGHGANLYTYTPGVTMLLPTSTSIPSGPQLLETATIGGTTTAFQAAYGAPGNDTALEQTFNVTQPGVMALVTVTLLGQTASDGVDHIVSLRIRPFSGDWDVATATPICAKFIPPDATYQKTINVPGHGPERVYHSAALSNMFEPGLFVDHANGIADTPGTFSMELGSDFSNNTGCILILGT